MPTHFLEFVTLAVCIGIPVLIGAISGIVTSQSIDTWYAGLEKPSFNPPNSLFAPVWTALYILMGVSLYMIWRSPGSPDRSLALLSFAVQLALNFFWSLVFFRFRQLTMALAEMILLWASILTMILLFHRVNEAAAYLQIPYLLWVGFAMVLNGAIRARNPGGHGPASGVTPSAAR